MKDNQEFLVSFYDKMLKNYLLLEKNIYEAINCYENEPSDALKEIIGNMCSNGRAQLSLLMEFLPKISKGEELSSNLSRLEIKSDELFYLRKKVLEQHQK